MKYVTIIGDSISTYEGCNPEDYAVYYDREFQKVNGLKSIEDTWWAKVIHAMDAKLCVNNSYFGSRVSGLVFPAAESDGRLAELSTEQHDPDIILIYIGFNDFGYGVKVRMKDCTDDPDEESFEEAYDHMLRTIRRKYPDAFIFCATHMRTRVRNRELWEFPEDYAGYEFEQYNNVIREVCHRSELSPPKCHAL